jgi:hypothetical protein
MGYTMKSRAFILHPLILLVLLSCTAREASDDFLIVRVDYSSGMLGSSADVTITQQEHPFVSMPVYDQAPVPLDVVFRDQAGEVVTRKAMTVTYFNDQMVVIDGPLSIRWVTWVTNDDRFACVGFESALDKGFHPERLTAEELPLPLCSP